MKTYLVGGAVRDKLMGKDPIDKDYVVTGSSIETMKSMGFEQVGADFPVFLHPTSRDEYALARTERKVGQGYIGFDTDCNSNITIEDDLSRRDLTINSIAIRSDGEEIAIIDPYHGSYDIIDKIFRATSDAFMEDPVRVLRLARFAARFGPGWIVAQDTKDMIQQMIKSGVLNELNKERVWKELSRALCEPHPRYFFDTLKECGALGIFPEVEALTTVPESPKWHTEGDTYEHTMLVLTQAALQFPGKIIPAFCALVHDFGKAKTDPEKWPSHKMHEILGVPVVAEFADRVSAPANIKKVALMCTRWHMHMHKIDEMKPRTIAKMLTKIGGFSNPSQVSFLLMIGKCDHRGRLGSENASLDSFDRLENMFKKFLQVRFADVFTDPSKFSGEQIGEMMITARGKAIAEWRKENGK